MDENLKQDIDFLGNLQKEILAKYSEVGVALKWLGVDDNRYTVNLYDTVINCSVPKSIKVDFETKDEHDCFEYTGEEMIEIYKKLHKEIMEELYDKCIEYFPDFKEFFGTKENYLRKNIIISSIRDEDWTTDDYIKARQEWLDKVSQIKNSGDDNG